MCAAGLKPGSIFLMRVDADLKVGSAFLYAITPPTAAGGST
jgi:hypothetical protein